MFKKNTYFITHYFGFIALLAMLICLFNWIIDPYGIFNNEYLSIDQKPAALTQMRMYKAHRVDMVKPQTIILGTSRAAVGFDPCNHMFKQTPVYNLGLDGANIFEMKSYLEHANRFGQLREVILALDFMSFNFYMDVKPDFKQERLGKTPQTKLSEPNFFLSLFSYSASTDSLKTIFKKFDKSLPTMNEQGLTLEKALFFYKEINGGHHNTSRYSERNYIKDVYRPFNTYSSDGKSSTFEPFAEILKYCHLHQIKLKMIISPTHIRHHYLLDKLELWDKYEAWKRMLVHYNESIANEMHTIAFDLWDFTDFNDFTAEELPPIDDNQYQMKWFWETSHFNKQLGDKILKRIAQTHDIKDTSSETHFGTLINNRNINAHLNRIRLNKNIYAQQKPDVVDEITSLFNEATLAG